MEIIGGIASSLQIVSQCAQITMTVLKWVESVNTVDDRIRAFLHEVKLLRTTYESLEESLKGPSVREAASITNRDAGGHLWSQISQTLRDCSRTLNTITRILQSIESTNRHLKSMHKQLKEQLKAGELTRLREELVMYNSSLQLPMQMIAITLQLRQLTSTTAHQSQLDDKLSDLRRAIERVAQMSERFQVHTPRRASTFGGDTVVGNSTADQNWLDNMGRFVDTAKSYYDSASVAARTLTAPSTGQRLDEGPQVAEGRRGSGVAPLTKQALERVDIFVEDLPERRDLEAPVASDAQFAHDPNVEYSDSDDEVDDTYLVLLQTLLLNGHEAVDRNDYAFAEECFRDALEESQGNNFSLELACSSADIALLLGECLAKQEKYDDAIKLLEPLTNMRAPNAGSSSVAAPREGYQSLDKMQALSAHHLLGKVYIQKSDLNRAEVHAKRAFEGRRKLLGQSNAKTLESIQLMIDLYEAKGNNARAIAFQSYLKPIQPIQQSGAVIATPSSPTLPPPLPTLPEQIQRGIAASPDSGKRENTGLRALFRLPRQGRRNTSDSSPSLVADDDIRVLDKHARQPSLYSNDSSKKVPTMTTRDSTDIQSVNAEPVRNSLTRIPTLYENLSRPEMEEILQAISRSSGDSKVDKGIKLIRAYDPEVSIINLREPELRKNINKSGTKGLAGTGHGFAPIHFFCSLKQEYSMEVELLLRNGADPNTIAHKAGYPKYNPFTPLSMAVLKGHTNIVKSLLDYGATWDPEVFKRGCSFLSDPINTHPLLQACLKGYAKIVHHLLNRGISLKEGHFKALPWHGNSLLHEACFRCDLAMVETLMCHQTNTDGSYSFVGSPGQQDSFGKTPIMYAVDIRETTEPKAKAHKLQNRVACLRILLQEEPDMTADDESDEVLINRPRSHGAGRTALNLHLQDIRGNTVYSYADPSNGGDIALKAFLDEQARENSLIDFE